MPRKPPRRRKRGVEPDDQGRFSLKTLLGECELVFVEVSDRGVITLTPTDRPTARVDSTGRVNLNRWLDVDSDMFIAEKHPDSTVTLTPVSETGLAGHPVKIRGEYKTAPGAEEE